MSTKTESLNCKRNPVTKSKSFSVDISGPLAMFGTPTSKQNCEMISYPMPTYSALCGMMNHIYYRPGIKWEIEQCRVMNKIQYQDIRIKTPHYREKSVRESNRVRIFNYAYLSGVRYQINAHYVIDQEFVNDTHGFCAFVHDEGIIKAIEYGPEKIVSLGKSNTGMAVVRPCDWGEGNSYYDGSRDSAPVYMFHNFRFDGKDWERRISNVGFCWQKMINGIIDFNDLTVYYQPWKRERRANDFSSTS